MQLSLSNEMKQGSQFVSVLPATQVMNKLFDSTDYRTCKMSTYKGRVAKEERLASLPVCTVLAE